MALPHAACSSHLRLRDSFLSQKFQGGKCCPLQFVPFVGHFGHFPGMKDVASWWRVFLSTTLQAGGIWDMGRNCQHLSGQWASPTRQNLCWWSAPWSTLVSISSTFSVDHDMDELPLHLDVSKHIGHGLQGAAHPPIWDCALLLFVHGLSQDPDVATGHAYHL